MTIKLIDGKGRLMLGNKFAGRTVIVDDTDPTRLVIMPAIAVPEREAWLYKNEKALSRLRAGLEQARSGRANDSPPDLDADSGLADQLGD